MRFLRLRSTGLPVVFWALCGLPACEVPHALNQELGFTGTPHSGSVRGVVVRQRAAERAMLGFNLSVDQYCMQKSDPRSCRLQLHAASTLALTFAGTYTPDRLGITHYHEYTRWQSRECVQNVFVAFVYIPAALLELRETPDGTLPEPLEQTLMEVVALTTNMAAGGCQAGLSLRADPDRERESDGGESSDSAD